jgi:hypothetical protein
MEHIKGILTSLDFGQTPMGQPRARFTLTTDQGQTLWGQTFGARAEALNIKGENASISLQGDIAFCDDNSPLDGLLLISNIAP